MLSAYENKQTLGYSHRRNIRISKSRTFWSSTSRQRVKVSVEVQRDESLTARPSHVGVEKPRRTFVKVSECIELLEGADFQETLGDEACLKRSWIKENNSIERPAGVYSDPIMKVTPLGCGQMPVNEGQTHFAQQGAQLECQQPGGPIKAKFSIGLHTTITVAHLFSTYGQTKAPIFYGWVWRIDQGRGAPANWSIRFDMPFQEYAGGDAAVQFRYTIRVGKQAFWFRPGLRNG
ncbi:hypothetical protein F5148DRAFT_1147500 [Russula earlei]|uniref:Uncharacterized protein n=1 Tax=Russula earlei TaxID=71964 RepID=A0ACC0UFH7_9AGAM|nr:hypothetical protein F5148DRAFT_1147500 [Russula earlei]